MPYSIANGATDVQPLGFKLYSLLLALTLISCASSQINHNTLEIASTYDQLITKQVTFNLSKAFKDKYGIPTFVKVTAQTATTQNSFTPTFSIPLTSQISKIAQTTTAVSGLTSLASRTTQLAGEGLSISAVDQWNQTYTLTPVTDTDQLRRLRVLYQYVTGHLADDGADAAKELESTYPLIETSGGFGGASTETTLVVTVDGKPVSVKQGSSDNGTSKTKYVRRTYAPSSDGSFKGYTWQLVNPDVTFIKQPGCVLCDYGSILSKDEIDRIQDKSGIDSYKTAHKLEKNVQLRNDWLYAPGEEVGSDAVALPSNGLETLYVRRSVNGEMDGGLKYFYEFALYSEDAASQGTGSPASGGQSNGRKTAPLERISIPVGGNTSNP